MTVAAAYMGLDVKRIPMLMQCFNKFRFPLCQFEMKDIIIHTVDKRLDFLSFYNTGPRIDFEPSVGWKNYIER